MTKRITYSLLLALLLALDQLSKLFISAQPYHIFWQIYLTKTVNKNTILTRYLELNIAIIISLIIVVVLCILHQKSRSDRHKIAFILIISGGLSNLLDLTLHSGVIDILTINQITFNLADFYIMASLILLLVSPFPNPSKR